MSATYVSLTPGQRQDVRASQRTFEGAYLRTAFSKLSFGLVILRLFSKEFFPLGMVYVASAIMTMALSLYQRAYSERLLIEHPSTTFVTAGNIVVMTATIDILSQITLFILILRL